MKIHFLLLALVAVVALSQHNVDARLHDPALRRMTEHRLLDELLQRRMEALEEMEGEQDSLQDGFVESRRLGICYSDYECPRGQGCYWGETYQLLAQDKEILNIGNVLNSIFVNRNDIEIPKLRV